MIESKTGWRGAIDCVTRERELHNKKGGDSVGIQGGRCTLEISIMEAWEPKERAIDEKEVEEKDGERKKGKDVVLANKFEGRFIISYRIFNSRIQ